MASPNENHASKEPQEADCNPRLVRLLPCPFCGSEARIGRGNGWPGETVIECSNNESCRAQMSCIWGEKNETELWNTRTGIGVSPGLIQSREDQLARTMLPPSGFAMEFIEPNSVIPPLPKNTQPDTPQPNQTKPMTPTPRTDKEWEQYTSNVIQTNYIRLACAMVRLSTELETELASITAERDGLQRAYDAALRQMNEAIAKAEWLRTDRIAQLERELAEMTADRDEWKYALTSIHPTDRGTPAEMARDIMDGATALREALKFSAGERDSLAEYKADIENAMRGAMDESCDCNERHCSCVPLLRAEIKWLRAITTSFDDELEP